MKILHLYAGKISSFGPRGELSAIDKTALDQADVCELGMLEDMQADKRVHGGPEKALHQFALSSYEKLIKRYPLQHKAFVPGCIGENITVDKMDDGNVCIGDIYQMGEVKVQVSSPRVPCWKIAHKLNIKELDKYIASKGICGWYYRVLEPGRMKLGNRVKMLERPNPDLSVQRFTQLANNTQADQAELKHASLANGLDPAWQQRLERKLKISALR